jgi:hypothetical protein
MSQIGVIDAQLTLSVAATSESALSYQWYKDDLAIAGATSATYTIATVSAATAGTYMVIITSSAASVTSAPATITVAAKADVGHLINLSIRAPAAGGAQTLIVGFAVSGDKRLLMRGIGPTLTAYGVTTALPDPKLTLYANGTAIDGNDNWGGDEALTKAFSAVGAFGLSPASKDAALLREVAPGSYTAHITTTDTDSGSALAELYDANLPSEGHLTNISGRAHIGSAALIAGFVISGNVPRRVLIRVAGPALNAFGVTGTLADPKLDLYLGGTVVQANDDWGANDSQTEIAAIARQVGAFAFADGSKDAALLVTLSPGAYTATVGSANAGTGVALIEVYEAP